MRFSIIIPARNEEGFIARCLASIQIAAEPFVHETEIFGIEKNSTVSSVVERLKLEIERNKNLNKRIGILRAKLTKSQE